MNNIFLKNFNKFLISSIYNYIHEKLTVTNINFKYPITSLQLTNINLAKISV